MLKAAESASNKAHATWMHMTRTAVAFDEENQLWKMYLKKEEEVVGIAQKIFDLDVPHPPATVTASDMQNATSDIRLV